MKTQIYLLITLVFLISLTSCVVRIINVDEPVPVGISTTALQAIIESGNLSAVATSADPLVTNTLTYLTTNTKYTANTDIKAIYATESGAGAKDGSSWANAIAATALRKAINDISDASANRVYAVLVAGGTYKPTSTTGTANTAERGISFAMKNHVAIIGGFTSAGGWDHTGTTTFSGDIGAIGNSNDNSYHVFSHNNITLDHALLYGATITKGNIDTTEIHDGGAGMYNNSSSPRLVSVVFSDNTTARGVGLFGLGGGMLNASASPVLKNVVFEGNHANFGGGIYNNVDCSPVLTSVIFRNNSASRNGGGVYDIWSSSVFKNVVFSGNSGSHGGGLFLSPRSNDNVVLAGVVFANNRASEVGGGIHLLGDRQGKLTLVNTVFTGNSVSNSASGHDIGVTTAANKTVNIHVAGSVLGFGLASPTNGIKSTSDGVTSIGPINITHHSLANTAVNLGSDRTTASILTYPTIQSTSSALNIGLHLRRNGTTYYYSEDGTTWYTGLLSTGGLDTSKQFPLPASAEDLTSMDIAGNTRNGRPDAGVYEYR